MRGKKKTAPDAGTSKGGNGDTSSFSIGHGIDPVKAVLKQLGTRQQPGDQCPRCGDGIITMHTISRYADVYICQHCKDDEQHASDSLNSVSLTGYEIVKLVKASRATVNMTIAAFESYIVEIIAESITRKIENYMWTFPI